MCTRGDRRVEIDLASRVGAEHVCHAHHLGFLARGKLVHDGTENRRGVHRPTATFLFRLVQSGAVRGEGRRREPRHKMRRLLLLLLESFGLAAISLNGTAGS